MDEAERGLHELLIEKLTADDTVPDAVSDLILAAWDGPETLAARLAGDPPVAAADAPASAGVRYPDVYLAAIHVEGFRGVGEPATLGLKPGPGLTLVTGRNGSGKSSFAEAAELALTGDSGRWRNRSAIWRDGWRNLHGSGETSVSVDLLATDINGTTRIERRWAPEAPLEDAVWTRQQHGAKRVPFTGAEWGEAMTTYRPFLSYSELGALIDGKPSELHDAVRNLLGLGPLTAAQEHVRRAKKQRADAATAVGRDRRALRDELLTVEDPRAARAAQLLKATAPDLVAVAELAIGNDNDAAELVALQAVAEVELPGHEAIAGAAHTVRAASDALTQLTTAETSTAEQAADLLRIALHHHELTGDGVCPVCTVGRLDDDWRTSATARAAEIAEASQALRASRSALSDAIAAIRRLITPVPAAFSAAPLDTADAQSAWDTWAAAATEQAPAELAHAVTAAHGPLAAALAELQGRARAEIERRDVIWGAYSRRLGTWHDAAAGVERDREALAALKAAEAWLVATADSLRDERLAPFAAASQSVWDSLRQQSSVTLGSVRLAGSSTQRRVALDVSIDGAQGGAALAVMSQGELHALGLSLFLPRATVDDSPFRFVLIDDPVQAMDPAKVDGLARVLSEVARTRQVVVFTHDDRLSEAVRRLEVPATIWEVQRREKSLVETRRSNDPVRRYLDDARAIAKTPQFPADMRAELVASCCRSAIEAACHAKVRHVRLSRGDAHADVEAALSAAVTTHQKATLAVFDDRDRGSDLLPRLAKVGGWAADALQLCRKGAHQGFNGDARQLVSDASRLAEWLQK